MSTQDNSPVETGGIETRQVAPAAAQSFKEPHDTDQIVAGQANWPIDLDFLLSVKLVKLSELISRGAAQIYETRFGVKNTELRILLQLGKVHQLSVNELSRRTRIDKGWISRSLDGMIARGLIERSAHSSDSRISLVSLTETGQRLLLDVAPIAVERNVRLLDGFNAPEIFKLVEALYRRAEEMLEDGEPEPAAKSRKREG